MALSPVKKGINHTFGSQLELEGVPCLGRLPEENYAVRASRILGVKPNTLLRMIKEHASSVYRSAKKNMELCSINHTKDEALHQTLAEIFCSLDLRRKLMLEHGRQSYSNGRPERVPVLEYALIKDWKPEYDLQSGLDKDSPLFSAKSHLNNLEVLLDSGHAISMDDFASPDVDDHEKGWVKHKSNDLKVSVASHFYTTLGPDDYSACQWRDSFNPYWVVPIADEVFLELCEWPEKDEKAKSKLAGAAFAVASIAQSAAMLRAFMELQPELGCYYKGLVGVNLSGPGEAKPWPTSIAERSKSELNIALLPLLKVQVEMAANPSLHHIEKMRSIIDSCEQAIFNISARGHEHTKKILAQLKDELISSAESFKVTGHDLDFSNLNSRLSLWEALLRDHRMGQPGKEQAQKQIEAHSEIGGIKSKLGILNTSFNGVNKKRIDILQGSLTWAEQASILQELNEDITQLKLGYEKLDMSYATLPAPKLLLPDPEPQAEKAGGELDPDNEKDQRIELLVEEVEKHRARATALNAENDALRQDNASVKQQLENLHYSYSESRAVTASASFTPELEEMIDNLAEGASPREVLRLLEVMHPTRVRMLKSAFGSAGDHSSLISSATLYHKLKIIITEGLDLVRESGRLIDMQDIVPGDLAVQESHTVRSHSKLKAFRTFRDGAETRLIFTHINLDYRTRLYFDYDQEESRILVAYVGKHLPTAKSSTI